MNDKIKYILSVIGGFIATATKQYGLILLKLPDCEFHSDGCKY